MRGRDRKDDLTMDLLKWEPPKVAVAVEQAVSGHGQLQNRIARLVGHALRNGVIKDRHVIASEIGEYLGRKVSKDILDKWASEGAENNRIPFDAMIALVDVTGVTDLLGFMPEMFGMVVVPERYATIIELHQIEEHEDALERHAHELNQRKAGLQSSWRRKK